MRSLILIALCLAVANATYFSKNRFQNLLNRYQNRFDSPYGNRFDMTNNLLGSDDVDDYVDDYVDEIRRERMFGRNQCPRDFEDVLGMDDEDIYQNWDSEDMFQGSSSYLDDIIPSNRRYMEDIPSRRYSEDIPSRRYSEDIPSRRYMEDVMPSSRYMSELDDTVSTISPMLKEVEDANVKLASRLYKQCKDERDDKNTVVSPLSIQLALAALNYGTRGNTKRQIGRVIGGRLQKQERKQVFKTLIRHLKGLRSGDYTTRQTKINCVTGIFVAQTTRAQQQFVQLVKGNLGASVKHCTFSHKPQQCRQVINKWMSQRTQHKINHIVPQDAITDHTKMVLVNALELKATWGPQMRRHVTKEAKFYPLDSKKVKIVEVMETQGRFKYFEDELVKIVGVPTKDQELTLYTIVPKEKDGLTEVEKLHLQDSVQLKQILDKTDRRVRNVAVQLPKFQIKHKIDVRRTLRKQGVTDAFDPQRADFSGITGVNRYIQDEMEEYDQMRPFRRNPFLDTDMEYGMMNEEIMGQRETKLHLNKFIHQATIKITENGITATTGSQMDEIEELENIRTGRMMGGYESIEELNTPFDDITSLFRREPTGEKIVKANRAFAFVVRHNPTQQLLLVGRVIDAAQKKIVNTVPQTINTVDQW